MKDIIGQASLISKLQSFGDSFPSSVLLEGGKGHGKRYILKKYIKWWATKYHPEVNIPEVQLDKEIFPDVRWLHFNDESSMSVSDFRVKLLEYSSINPSCLPYAFVCVCADKPLNGKVQNSLLKIVEEPAMRVKMVILTPAKELLIKTIMSRVALLEMDPYTAAEGIAILGKKISCDKDILPGLYNAVGLDVPPHDNPAELLKDFSTTIASALNIKPNGYRSLIEFTENISKSYPMYKIDLLIHIFSKISMKQDAGEGTIDKGLLKKSWTDRGIYLITEALLEVKRTLQINSTINMELHLLNKLNLIALEI